MYNWSEGARDCLAKRLERIGTSITVLVFKQKVRSKMINKFMVGLAVGIALGIAPLSVWLLIFGAGVIGYLDIERERLAGEVLCTN